MTKEHCQTGEAIDSLSTLNRPLRSVMVVRYGIPDDRAGSRQRSLMFLQTLCELGPTTLLLNSRSGKGPSPDLLPEAASLNVVNSRSRDAADQRVGKPPHPVLVHINKFMQRFMPNIPYARDKKGGAFLHRVIAEQKPDIVLFRYVDEMLRCAYGRADVPLTIVDVDDRPDLRLFSTYRRILGTTITRWVMMPYVGFSVMRQIKKYLEKADLVYFTKPDDTLALRSPETRIMRNVPYFDVVPEDERSVPTLLFVGAQDYYPNAQGIAWFIRNCWPSIVDAQPDARLRVVGSGDLQYLSAKYGHVGGIDIVGPVDDLATEYAMATATISPIFEGAGSQIKIIESCAFARPAVCSRFSSGGFGPEIDAHLIVADSKDDFVTACLSLLQDPSGAEALGETLRALQQKHLTRETFKSRLRIDILAALSRRNSTTREVAA